MFPGGKATRAWCRLLTFAVPNDGRPCLYRKSTFTSAKNAKSRANLLFFYWKFKRSRRSWDGRKQERQFILGGGNSTRFMEVWVPAVNAEWCGCQFYYPHSMESWFNLILLPNNIWSARGTSALANYSAGGRFAFFMWNRMAQSWFIRSTSNATETVSYITYKALLAMSGPQRLQELSAVYLQLSVQLPRGVSARPHVNNLYSSLQSEGGTNVYLG